MISDPSFVEAHRSRSADALLFSVPDKSSRPWKYTLVSVKNGEARRQPAPVLSPPEIEFSHRHISQAVNGLVCIYEQYEEDYDYTRQIQFPRVLVYNPGTLEHVTLPPPTAFIDVWLWRRSSQSISLGFDPSTNTYKILTELMCGDDRYYEIFTLGGGGAWRIIKDNDRPVYGLTRKGICVNGTIYWAQSIKLVGGEEMRQNVMIAFDVGEEKFREVPIPPATRTWWGEGWGRTWNMIEIGGDLAIVDFHEVVESISDVMTMWKLEDSVYGIWSIKTIVLPEFCTSSSRLPYTMRRPFMTSMDGGEITLIPNGLFKDWYIFHCNLEKESGRKEVISRSPEDDWNWKDGPYQSIPGVDSLDISVYKESLISLSEICSL